MELDYGQIEDKIVAYIREKVAITKASGVIIGISGGIDSSVVATLALKALGKDRVYGLILPCESRPIDVEHGCLLADLLNIKYRVVDLTSTYESLIASMEPRVDSMGNFMAFGNVKPRLRMTSLYFEGSLRNYLVIGTTNKSEWVTGYYTKYGDGGVDFEPIGDLLKREVVALGRHLGLPPVLTERTPDAGLVGDLTDEDEFGFTYEALDHYIETGQGDKETIEKIQRLYQMSEHKRNMPDMLRLDRKFFID